MKFVSKIALAAALATPTLAMAQDGPNTGALSFTAGVDVATSYYFRGYLQENAGLILQPYATLGFDVVDSDDYSIGLTLNTWNSIHSEQTLSDGEGAGAWYENDLFATLPISFGNFTVTPIYTLYQYPNGAFESIQEVGLTLAYDDAELLGDFTLSPYVGVFYEFDDGNGEEDTYLELGITPGYTFNAGGFELPLTFPVVLGMSIDDYYVDSEGDNEFFGYIQAGITTSLPIPLDERYGAWSLNLGGYYQYLFADSLEAANNDSDNVFWGKIGISFTY